MAMPVEKTVKITLPSQFEWTKNPNGSDMALLKGNFSDVGVQHVFRVKWPKGMKMMPHTHPDERTVTVMSGSYGFAEGSVFDPAKLKPYPAGAMIVVPAGVPHYGGSEEGAEFQEMGMSPTSTDWIPQPAEVRKPAAPTAPAPAPAKPASQKK